MRNEASQAGLRRMVTGVRCEVQGCYSVALWLVSFKGETSHRCLKHTMEFMAKASRKGNEARGVSR